MKRVRKGLCRKTNGQFTKCRGVATKRRKSKRRR